jgi:large conductance mechanosensitive channel
MGLIKEFKDFAMRGNVIDLAVGVIMGTAFGKIVSSLVQDIVMPPIGFVLGQFEMKNFKFDMAKLRFVTEAAPEAAAATPPGATAPAAEAAKGVMINIGSFLETTLDFVIVAICIFLMVRAMNTLWRKKDEQAKPPQLSTQEKLLLEIRDLLQAQATGGKA